MNDTVMILIISASIIASIWEYRKLITTLRPKGNRDEFLRFIGESALLNHIRSMDDEGFNSLCKKFFESSGYRVEETDDNMFILKDLKEPIYAKFIRIDKDSKVGMSPAMELYGRMCHKKVKKGILITNSQFEDNVYSFGSEVNISTMDIYEMVDEIKVTNEEDVKELLPELN